ncbi:peptidoglycan DD-metalloendopeptidase family protein [Nocardia carnea]|uniref:Peptidoglycan DD-metalloendopeptidase family protein n=1 Tax=Nocardia carnea TaxID=37328 RepID=A0ABW7TX36_9NOCA
MNHHGTLDAQHNGHRRRPRSNSAPAAEAPQPFNAFGTPGDSRARRRPLNTAAASAAADSQRGDSQRSAADDFWSTNQSWAESGDAHTGRGSSEPQPTMWSEPQPATWSGPQTAGWSEPQAAAWPEPQNTTWSEPEPARQEHQPTWSAPQAGPWPEPQTTAWSGRDWQGEDGWNRSDKPAWHSDPNWNSHQSWGEAQTWADEPAAGSTADAAPHNRPGTIAEALANGPAKPETDDESRSARSRGAHRVAAPPAALKGRAAVVAVAAGAVVAAGQCATAAPGEQQKAEQATDYEAAGSVHEIAAQSMATEGPAVDPHSPQMLTGGAPLDTSRFGEMLANGAEFAKDLAAAEEAKYRPLFAHFTAAGSFTSGFGARWGVQHLGVDIAAPIGTPIYAVADGEIIDAGPAAGFGMWVRVLHADGTITVYGHVDTTTVSVGEYVLAGDQIATMGNRGFSTGPHVHFEVWLNGSDKIDPIPWLATRGISLTGNSD